MKSIVLYTTSLCAYCHMAKRLLTKRGVEFKEVNLARDPDGRRRLVKTTGHRTFPQIVVDGELLGDYQELARLDRSGELEERLGLTR